MTLEEVRKVVKKEIEVLEFWHEEVDKLLHKKTESLSALLQEFGELSKKMKNRLDTVKRSGI